MNDAWFDNTLAWIGEHPVAAGGLIFMIAFLDSLIIVGIVVPALPLLFAVGTLIGLGAIDGTYAICCAAAGAVSADALSYWIGRRWGAQVRELWPFSRYPQLLDRGESMFRRHDLKAILVARFVGAIRPFVPAIAGMMHMPLKRYLPVSTVAALAWAGVLLAPGWVLGASYDAVAAVADRLALVLGALLIVLGVAWACVLYSWRWFDAHASQILARALRLARAHPRLGRYVVGLIDPRRPESPSLAVLAVCLLFIGWAWFTLLGALLVRGEHWPIDHQVNALMITLRNPLADQLLAGIASIGDVAVLAPSVGLAMAWLLWRRRWIAAAHWLAALAFGLLLTAGLSFAVHMPAPPTAPAGFSFPAMGVTMSTIAFGFFAVLIARELPGRSRVWPYMLAGLVVTLQGFARIYLGAHWLSDVISGILFGIIWLLVLGIAYRRHVARSFWMAPLAWIFYGSFVVAALWHAPKAVDPLLARFAPQPPALVLEVEEWWEQAWSTLPANRNERGDNQRWPLDLQIAGSLDPLRERLEAAGWSVQPQADWPAALSLLDDDTPPEQQPVLPATLGTEAETLLLRRVLSEEEIEVLRLWRAPARLHDGTPLWVGTVQTMTYTRPFGVLGLWQPQADQHAAWKRLSDTLNVTDARLGKHPQSGLAVLRWRIDATATPLDFEHR